MQKAGRYQELLDQARAFKESGNQHYQDKDYRGAIRCYHKCLLSARVVQQVPDAMNLSARLSQVSEENGQGDGDVEEVEVLTTEQQQAMKAEADEIVLKCYNNLAASLLNGPGRDTDTYLRVADYCEKVLAKEPGNQKALFRKGQALFKAGAHEKAIEAFDKCPNNAEAKKHRHLCTQTIEADRKRRGEEIRRNFERAQQKQAARDQAAAAVALNMQMPGPSQQNGVVHQQEAEEDVPQEEIALNLPNGEVLNKD